ncbi:hypothetical protein XENOCAPTIV_028290 [Xenoophorus captivus]|uniref:Uncharacterized protein n=1 Tax=Xenoophorus captivus TaxID=1517983 RepID=A0ABV0QBT9_9TELE
MRPLKKCGGNHSSYVNKVTLIQHNKTKEVNIGNRGASEKCQCLSLRQHAVPDGKHTFCVFVYYLVLDNTIGELGRRFSNTNWNIMQGTRMFFMSCSGCVKWLLSCQ